MATVVATGATPVGDSPFANLGQGLSGVADVITGGREKKALEEARQLLAQAGGDPKKMAQLISGNPEIFSALSGPDFDRFAKELESARSNALSERDVSTRESDAASLATRRTAQTQQGQATLTQSGQLATDKAAATLAAQTATAERDLTTLQNVSSGEIRSFPSNDPRIKELLDQGFVEAPRRATVETGEQFGLGGLTKADTSDAIQNRVKLALNAAQVSQTIKEFSAAFETSGGGAVGLRALMGEKVGGFVSQFVPELGQALTRAVAGGLSQGELSTLRTNAAATVASLIQPFTGEGSNRISESEREIVADLVGIVGSVTTTPEALKSALNVALKLQFTTLDKEAFLSGEDGIPLETDEDRLAFLTLLSNLGMDKATAIRAIRQIQDQRTIIELTGGR